MLAMIIAKKAFFVQSAVKSESAVVVLPETVIGIGRNIIYLLCWNGGAINSLAGKDFTADIVRPYVALRYGYDKTGLQ